MKKMTISDGLAADPDVAPIRHHLVGPGRH